VTDDDVSRDPVLSEAQEDEPVPDGSEVSLELEQARARVMELENLLAQQDEELAQAITRIAELEKTVASLDERLAQAVTSYKALVIKSNPEVFEELVSGDSIQAVDAALEKARHIVGKVRKGLESEMTAARVPAGAPQRHPVDLSVLSPREKIKYGIGGSR